MIEENNFNGAGYPTFWIPISFMLCGASDNNVRIYLLRGYDFNNRDHY